MSYIGQPTYQFIDMLLQVDLSHEVHVFAVVLEVNKDLNEAILNNAIAETLRERVAVLKRALPRSTAAASELRDGQPKASSLCYFIKKCSLLWGTT